MNAVRDFRFFFGCGCAANKFTRSVKRKKINKKIRVNEHVRTELTMSEKKPITSIKCEKSIISQLRIECIYKSQQFTSILSFV